MFKAKGAVGQTPNRSTRRSGPSPTILDLGKLYKQRERSITHMPHEIKFVIDPDRSASYNADRMVWKMLEWHPGKVGMYHFCPLPVPVMAKESVNWLYHQYVIWYDSAIHDTPISALVERDVEAKE